jgi:hypothetical protein
MHKANLKGWLAMSIICVGLTQATTIARIIYVDDDANGLNDGSSWANAYCFLQDALSDANSDPNVNEIRVAQGIYKPDANSADPNGSGDRYATFELINGVSLIGGYAGLSEPDPNIRDIQLYESSLSGDLNGDDEPNFINNAENSYNVAHIIWTNGTTILDGFTIVSGDANNPGLFRTSRGGGLCNEGGGDVTLKDCTFISNRSFRGGGVFIQYSTSSSIVNCVFANNSVQYGAGGSCDGKGGGIYLNEVKNILIDNCFFYRNRLIYAGGAAIGLYYSSPTIINCRFVENSISDRGYGGAIYCFSFGGWPAEEKFSNPTIIDSEFICNKAGTNGGGGGAIYFRGECHSTLINCKFVANFTSGGYALGGGAIWEQGIFQNCYNTLLNCTLVGNTTTGSSGGWGGGGFAASGWTRSSLINCILWGNRSADGTNEMSQISVVQGSQSDVSVKFSCIQDDNPDDDYIPFGGVANHNIDDNPHFVREPNDGGDGWGVGDNDDFGDVHLSPKSPCIDIGDNNSVPVDLADLDNDGNTAEPIPFDLDGRARIFDGDCNGTNVVDMGAYEFSYAYFGDFDNQCDVDFDDLKEIASHWLQKEPLFDIAPPPIGDGIVNFKDLAVLSEHWLEGTTP